MYSILPAIRSVCPIDKDKNKKNTKCIIPVFQVDRRKKEVFKEKLKIMSKFKRLRKKKQKFVFQKFNTQNQRQV